MLKRLKASRSGWEWSIGLYAAGVRHLDAKPDAALGWIARVDGRH
jgi:hypothetical protein